MEENKGSSGREKKEIVEEQKGNSGRELRV